MEGVLLLSSTAYHVLGSFLLLGRQMLTSCPEQQQMQHSIVAVAVISRVLTKDLFAVWRLFAMISAGEIADLADPNYGGSCTLPF